MSGALEAARAEEPEDVPRRGFVAAHAASHPEHRDLLADGG